VAIPGTPISPFTIDGRYVARSRLSRPKAATDVYFADDTGFTMCN
jgi:hypothetical protein